MPSHITFNEPSKSWHQHESPLYTSLKQNEWLRPETLICNMPLPYSSVSFIYICTALGLNLDFLAEWGIAINSPHCFLKRTPNVGVFLPRLAASLSTAPHSTSKTAEKGGIKSQTIWEEKFHYRGRQ